MPALDQIVPETPCHSVLPKHCPETSGAENWLHYCAKDRLASLRTHGISTTTLQHKLGAKGLALIYSFV